MKIYLKICIVLIGVSALMYTACKKGSTTTTATNTNTGTTDPTPTKGQAIIYLKQDCNVGNVTATINGKSGLIRGYSSYSPGCSADSSYAIFSLDAGTYPITASAGNLTWSGSITVTSGQCSSFQLTCDGITPTLKGLAGTPRFNLQHSTGVDFDLHVVTPDNTEINSYNTSGGGGKLDLQSNCIGSDTNYSLTGLTLTNENVWFPVGAAQHGAYKFWVQFSATCANALSGTYTLRVINGIGVTKTYTGTLTSTTTKSAVYTITY